MDKQRQEDIIKLLTEKGAIEPCPRCKHPQFELLGEASIPLNQVWGNYGALSSTVPVILIACNNCGYMAHHAKGVLDLKRSPQ